MNKNISFSQTRNFLIGISGISMYFEIVANLLNCYEKSTSKSDSHIIHNLVH